MATITGLSKQRMLEIENNSIVSGRVDSNGHLMLKTKGGTESDAGSVQGPAGPSGNLLAAWPVGSIFIAAVSTNPATLLGGGTWARESKGRVIVGLDENQLEFDTLSEVGGAKSVTLSTDQMPKHSHALTSSGSITVTATGTASGGAAENNANSVTQGGSSGRFNHPLNASGTSAQTGGGAAHENMPPYIVFYIWKRTA